MNKDKWFYPIMLETTNYVIQLMMEAWSMREDQNVYLKLHRGMMSGILNLANLQLN